MTGSHFARGLSIPEDGVTQTWGFVGKRGSGKTYGALRLAEFFLSIGAQVVYLDPVGKAWSLRLGADGKRPGFEIPVLGGHHGDLPLEPTAGALIADLVVDRGTSIVLDVSLLTQGELKRFVGAFAERLLQRKKGQTDPAPVHLFLEEAQEFVPEITPKGEGLERMKGAIVRLIKLGRNWGVGVTIITQRPQAVSKEALNQTECLVALQTVGAHERKALRQWISHQGEEVALVDELPKLQSGEAWVWSPGWLQILKRVRISKRSTYDASATPTLGKRAKAAEPKPIDLDALRDAMAETVEAAEANDPAKLRAKVRDLEKKLVQAEKAAPSGASEEELAEAREEGRSEGARAVVEKLHEAEGRRQTEILEKVELLGDFIQARPSLSLELDPLPPPPRPPPSKSARDGEIPKRSVARASTFPTVGGPPPETQLPRGALAILTAVAQHEAGVTRDQLSVLVGYKRSSRDTYLQKLVAAGLVGVSGSGRVRATEEGLSVLGPNFEPLPTGDALRLYWLGRLAGGERTILEVVCAFHPDPIHRDGISEATDYKRSSRDTYLQRLISRKLVEKVGGGLVKASETLFS